MGFGTVGVALLVANADVRAATAVDIYQEMASGKDGDLLTSASMNASTHPGAVGWAINRGPWFISTRHARNLPGPVTVGGVTYSGTGGSRTWMLNTSNAMNCVSLYAGKSDSRPAITVAFYYTTDLAVRNYHIYDTATIYCRDGTYCCMQQETRMEGGPASAHSCDSKWKTTYSPTVTKILAGKTYWINLNYNAAGQGTVSLATFDPDKAFAQVGTTLVSQSHPAKASPWRILLGRTDNHGNQTDDRSQTWFGHIMIDYTNAAFPLIPSAATNVTPPSARVGKQRIEFHVAPPSPTET